MSRPGVLVAAACLALVAAACAEGVTCGAGTRAVRGRCVPDYANSLCGPGTHDADGQCLPDAPAIACGDGTRLESGRCVPVAGCDPAVDPACGTPVACGPGTVAHNGVCVDAALQSVGLPFEAGATVKASQGALGYVSHFDDDVNAVDFDVPAGTRIVAARAGRVWAVKQDSDQGCETKDCVDQANFVRVDHGDGTKGDYWHLQLHGALVAVGDRVCKGQPLGLSGNTGFSTGPHLHFAVVDLFGQSLPLRFDEAGGADPGVVFEGGWFTSANAAPATCQDATAWSTCPVDTFADMGVVLDSATPCTTAAVDRDYPLSGTTALPGVVAVGRHVDDATGWVWDFVPTGADGRFETTVRWPSAQFADRSALMVTAAWNDGVGDPVHLGFHASPEVRLTAL